MMQWIYENMSHATLVLWLQVFVLVVVGFFIARFCSSYIGKRLADKLEPQSLMLAKKTTYYIILALFLVNAFNQLGFSISVLLGSAGVFAVAIGFAARTSISNVISGLFLLIEEPFVVGDKIRVKNYTGNVLSIDMMSTKVQTSENTLLRLPNETLLKSEVINLSHFDLQSCDLKVQLKNNLYAIDEAMDRLTDIITRLQESESKYKSQMLIEHVTDSEFTIKCVVWIKNHNKARVTNAFYAEVKKWLDEKNSYKN